MGMKRLPLVTQYCLIFYFFDMKLIFTQKYLVKDKYLTSNAIDSSFAVFISCNGIQISLTYLALNHLDVCIANTKSSYIEAPIFEQNYVICGLEYSLECQN